MSMKRGDVELDPNLIDHAVQKDIVRTLVSASSARFSELKPKRIESNLFMYHLNQLMQRGVVEKNDGMYSLTSKGRAFVDRANLDRLVFRVQPKILTILTIETTGGKWLLLERTHEPHMNRVGFPSGKIHFGEQLNDAAERELSEKTGITDIPLQLRGNIYMRFLDKNTLQTMNHIVGYVFHAKVAREIKPSTAGKYWRAFWGDESQLTAGNVFKGHNDILKLLGSKKPFIESFDYESDF